MESIRFGGRPAPGFGVGAVPQSMLVKQAEIEGFGKPFSRKMGAFVGGAIASGIAGVAATALFGEGTAGAFAGAGTRLQRSWRTLAATAVAGGIVGAVAAS